MHACCEVTGSASAARLIGAVCSLFAAVSVAPSLPAGDSLHSASCKVAGRVGAAHLLDVGCSLPAALGVVPSLPAGCSSTAVLRSLSAASCASTGNVQAYLLEIVCTVLALLDVGCGLPAAGCGSQPTYWVWFAAGVAGIPPDPSGAQLLHATWDRCAAWPRLLLCLSSSAAAEPRSSIDWIPSHGQQAACVAVSPFACCTEEVVLF